MTSAAVLRASVPAAERGACFHCGLPVAEAGRYTAIVDGAARDVCCPGCQAVAETIAGAGLQSYYRTRTAPPPRDGGEPLRPPTARALLEIYDRPELQRGFVVDRADGTLEATLILEDIHCAACVWLNEQHLARQRGVQSVDINYVSRRARVRWDPRSCACRNCSRPWRRSAIAPGRTMTPIGRGSNATRSARPYGGSRLLASA